MSQVSSQTNIGNGSNSNLVKIEANASIFRVLGAGWRLSKLAIRESINTATEVALLTEDLLPEATALVVDSADLALSTAVVEGRSALQAVEGSLTPEQKAAIVTLHHGRKPRWMK